MVRIAAGLVGEGRDDMLSRLLGAVISTTGVGIDVAAMEGMMAPGPGVQEGEGETLNGMVWVAAGLVGEGRDDMVSKFLGAVPAGSEGINGPVDAAAGADVRRRVGRAAVEGNEVVGRAAAETVEGAGILGGVEEADATASADVRRRERCRTVVFDDGADRAVVLPAIGILVRPAGPGRERWVGRRPSMGWAVRHFCFRRLLRGSDRRDRFLRERTSEVSGRVLTVPWSLVRYLQAHT